jgi:hypothetical protein
VLLPTLDAYPFQLQVEHAEAITFRELLSITSLSKEREPPQWGQTPAEKSSAKSLCRAADSGEGMARCCINVSFIDDVSGRGSLVFSSKACLYKEQSPNQVRKLIARHANCCF